LAYRDAVAVADSSLYVTGARAVGHEFHRTTVTFTESYQPAWVYRGADVAAVSDGAIHRNVHASYLHTHPAAQPHAVARFVAHAQASRLAG
jgi:cobyrinic acid a,c-diamide synthase